MMFEIRLFEMLRWLILAIVVTFGLLTLSRHLRENPAKTLRNGRLKVASAAGVILASFAIPLQKGQGWLIMGPLMLGLGITVAVMRDLAPPQTPAQRGEIDPNDHLQDGWQPDWNIDE